MALARIGGPKDGAMVEVSDSVVVRLAASVSAVFPLIVVRVPAGPAAILGRLGA
jgi:hypothetical protein